MFLSGLSKHWRRQTWKAEAPRTTASHRIVLPAAAELAPAPSTHVATTAARLAARALLTLRCEPDISPCVFLFHLTRSFATQLTGTKGSLKSR